MPVAGGVPATDSVVFSGHFSRVLLTWASPLLILKNAREARNRHIDFFCQSIAVDRQSIVVLSVSYACRGIYRGDLLG